MADSFAYILEFVSIEITQIRKSKGLPDVGIIQESVLLGQNLGLDSLDLATLIVTLQEKTRHDPFRSGFVMFRTVGELVNLFSNP
jgi:acyl carrier protein